MSLSLIIKVTISIFSTTLTLEVKVVENQENSRILRGNLRERPLLFQTHKLYLVCLFFFFNYYIIFIYKFIFLYFWIDFVVKLTTKESNPYDLAHTSRIYKKLGNNLAYFYLLKFESVEPILVHSENQPIRILES